MEMVPKENSMAAYTRANHMAWKEIVGMLIIAIYGRN